MVWQDEVKDYWKFIILDGDEPKNRQNRYPDALNIPYPIMKLFGLFAGTTYLCAVTVGCLLTPLLFLKVASTSDDSDD